jgi:hypothetical protein
MANGIESDIGIGASCVAIGREEHPLVVIIASEFMSG